MKKRIWLHRGVAAAMGALLLAGTMGLKAAKKHETDRALQAHRQRAAQKAATYFIAQGDNDSAQATLALARRHEQIQTGRLQPADVEYLLSVAASKVDQLVIARSLAILLGLSRQGKLNAVATEKVKLANRSLFHHPGFVVRAYALALAGELNDQASATAIAGIARDDPDPFVREQAEKTNIKLGSEAR